MDPVIDEVAPAMSGIEPRDEHDLRIWTPIAMWLAGACAIAVGTFLPGGGRLHIVELRWLVGFGLLAATFTFVVFRPASNRTLYVLTNVFSTLGALTVWLACFWSGGPSSGFAELYFFPVLYDAYFFRLHAKHTGKRQVGCAVGRASIASSQILARPSAGAGRV